MPGLTVVVIRHAWVDLLNWVDGRDALVWLTGRQWGRRHWLGRHRVHALCNPIKCPLHVRVLHLPDVLGHELYHPCVGCHAGAENRDDDGVLLGVGIFSNSGSKRNQAVTETT